LGGFVKFKRRRKKTPWIALMLAVAAALGYILFDKSASISVGDANDLIGRPSVIDGDTIDIRKTRIRLHGIDAPENGQPCGDAAGMAYTCGSKAAFALADRIGQGNVTCEARDRDRYGRIVAVCFLATTGEDLNAFMVRSGWALAYREYSSAYVDDEDAARQAKRGLWAGTFTPPWEYRNRTRTAKPATSPTDSGECLIKGNISKSGRIYHVPGSRWYSRTRIDRSRGERWFCSEAEARAAGWRAPRN
jgi:endonuclease YncB( thermonuclease family)